MESETSGFDEPIAPETSAFNAELERRLAAAPPLTDFEPAQVRAARERGESVFGEIRTVDRAIARTVTHDRRSVAVRLLVPDNPRGAYLHIHGGGWVLGRAHHSDVLNWQLSQATDLAVVSVDYRLAPEHRYPAGADDCETAARWLAENAQAELGTDRLFIGGESAGAHLAAVTLLRMRDRHGYRGFRAANLVYGCYDLTFTPSVANWGPRNLILSTPIIEWFTNHFVDPNRRRDPDVSPLYADLRSLPPALFTVGTLDPLLDDSLFMHARWRAAGNRSDLAVYAGGIHAFNAFSVAIADSANARMARFLADHSVA